MKAPFRSLRSISMREGISAVMATRSSPPCHPFPGQRLSPSHFSANAGTSCRRSRAFGLAFRQLLLWPLLSPQYVPPVSALCSGLCLVGVRSRASGLDGGFSTLTSNLPVPCPLPRGLSPSSPRRSGPVCCARCFLRLLGSGHRACTRRERDLILALCARRVGLCSLLRSRPSLLPESCALGCSLSLPGS